MQPTRSRFHEFVAALSASACVFVVACGDGPTSVRPIPDQIRLLSPTTNSGTPAWPLADSVMVEVLDAEGRALPGVPVTWTAQNGADVVGRAADTTNIAGRASAEWTLGRTEGVQTLSVRAGNLAPVTVTATATIFHARSVTVGTWFACALLESGRAMCWGWNYAGQLGIGTVGDRVRVPTPVAGDLVFSALSAGGAQVCGLTTEGTAYCWGSNESGETGTGALGASVRVPTPVQTALRFTSISAEGKGAFENSTCGLTETGEAWCWGTNQSGQLGNGSTSDSPVPVRVMSDVPFTSIWAGFDHTCATTATNDLWCWGEQETAPGAFGLRSPGAYRTPVLVRQGFSVTDLVPGWNFTCSLTVQHVAMCWGANWHGGLGTGDSEPSAVPTAVADGHSFVALSPAGYKETYGLTTDGFIYRWGTSGTEGAELRPLRVTDLRFTEVEAGEEPFHGIYGACGITAGNAVYCVDDDGLVRGVPAPAAP